MFRGAWRYQLIRKRLNRTNVCGWSIHKSASRARIQGDMRGNHIERVGETESVESLLKNAIDVVDIDRAAAGCRTRIGLRDQK